MKYMRYMAEDAGIADMLKAMGKEIEAIDGIVEVEFDITSFLDNTPYVILIPKYDIDVRREDYYDARRKQIEDILSVCKKYDCYRTEDRIEDYGEHWYIVTRYKGKFNNFICL